MTTTASQASAPVHAVDLGLSRTPMTAAPAASPAARIRARLDEQVRALLEHEPVAREGSHPEGVHQMRVSVRRIRAALKATGAAVQTSAALQEELRWLGRVLGEVRDLDVQLDHLRTQAAGFEPAERDAVERLLLGLRAARRKARQRLLAALRGHRYSTLLKDLAAAALSEAPPAAAPRTGEQRAAANVEVIQRPYRKLRTAAAALGDEPSDDDLHTLRIHGKRLRYAAELALPAGGRPVHRLIRATKQFQDVLGEHQDTVVAEELVRRLVAGLDRPVAPELAFAAGRLVERERARRADCRAGWRAALATVDSSAEEVLAGAATRQAGQAPRPPARPSR
ncbi:MAG: CHAD domain-containing protein [Labedaea sp.]